MRAQSCALALVAAGSAGCAETHRGNRTADRDLEVTVPGPPEGCRATYLLPAPGCSPRHNITEDTADPGTWEGDGTGGCALASPSDGGEPRWIFSLDDAGYRGRARCVRKGCASAVLVVAEGAPPPPSVLGEFQGEPELRMYDVAVPTGPYSADIGAGIPHDCPGGAYPGRPLSDWSPLAVEGASAVP